MKYLILLFAVSLYATDLRERIALVDTGININQIDIRYMCTDGNRDFTNTSIKDNKGHGTILFLVISDFIDYNKTCINVIKWYDLKGEFYNLQHSLNYIKENLPVKYMNLSLSGGGFYLFEFVALKEILNRGTIISVAAGNEHVNLSLNCETYPACYKMDNKNFHVVAACESGRYASYSNYGGVAKYCERGYTEKANRLNTGTSISCAVHTGKIAGGK